MSSEDNPHLEPFIEPETERRLTALILGEASDFERAELSQLLASDPELRALHDQLSETHSLLTAGESLKDQPTAWKLPEARRNAVLSLVGSELKTKAPAKYIAPAKRERSLRRVWQSAAAIIVLMLSGAAFGPQVVETLFKDNTKGTYTAAPSEILMTRGRSAGDSPSTPQFEQESLEEEIFSRAPVAASARPDRALGAGDIASLPSLPAVQQLPAGQSIARDEVAESEGWDSNYALSSADSESGSFRRFAVVLEPIAKEDAQISSVSNSDDFSFYSYADATTDAKDGEEVFGLEGSRGYTSESDVRRLRVAAEIPQRFFSESELQPLEVEATNQKDEVERARVEMLDIMVKNGIVDTTSEGGGLGSLGGSGDIAPRRIEAEQRIQEIEQQIAALEGKKGAELIAQVDSLSLKDSTISNWGFRYAVLQEKAESYFDDGYKVDDPEVKEVQAELGDVEEKLGRSVESLRSVLKTNLEIARQSLESVEALKDASEKQWVASRQNNDGYREAKMRFQAAERKYAEIQRQLEVEKNPSLQIRQAQAAVDLEVTTDSEPFSTFSLNVSDVSFKLAQTALLKNGQWPDESKIRPEEFVNALDYADPAPAPGAAVSNVTEQCVHPFLPGRNLLRVSMKTAATGRASSSPLRLTVLLDKSGSMEREDRKGSVAKAMEALAAQLKSDDLITVIGFARTPSLIADRLPGIDAAKLAKLVADAPSEGGTNLEAALKLAGESALRQFSDGAMNRIVLITDGAANLGDAVSRFSAAINHFVAR